MSCSSWMVTSGGRLRSQSPQGSSPVVGGYCLWVITAPPNHLPFTSSESVHSLNSLPPYCEILLSKQHLPESEYHVWWSRKRILFRVVTYQMRSFSDFYPVLSVECVNLQDTQQLYLWIQTYCHSHPDLQLSGLLSSCRITYCLPSGLQFLSHCNGSIPPSQLGSESKHTRHMHKARYPDRARGFCRGVTVLPRLCGGI